MQARVVRLRRGEIVDSTTVKRQKARKLGFSYSIEFVSKQATSRRPEEVEEVSMSLTTLGRKRPRDMVEKIQEYLRGDANELSIREHSGFE